MPAVHIIGHQCQNQAVGGPLRTSADTQVGVACGPIDPAVALVQHQPQTEKTPVKRAGSLDIGDPQKDDLLGERRQLLRRRLLLSTGGLHRATLAVPGDPRHTL